MFWSLLDIKGDILCFKLASGTLELTVLGFGKEN